MTKTLLVALLPAWALGGSALVAAPGQTYPGQPTQGHVMIDNKGPGQTIPVAVQQIAGDATLRVQVTNTTGVRAIFGFARMRRQTSTPVKPGMRTSNKTVSTSQVSSMSSACCPLAASITS